LKPYIDPQTGHQYVLIRLGGRVLKPYIDPQTGHQYVLIRLGGRVLKPYIDPQTGHQYVLIRLGGRASPARRLRSHHAVLLTYVGPRPLGAVGRHLNDDPSDNTVGNLAWGTRLDNARDRQGNRGYERGEDKPNARLTWEQVDAIRRDPRVSRIVGREYGVSHTAIQRIRRGERWA